MHRIVRNNPSDPFSLFLSFFERRGTDEVGIRDRNRQRGGYHLLVTVFLARNHPQRCPPFCARS